jgi:hypothetical protein
MTAGEVWRGLGVQPNGWVRAGAWIEDSYSLRGISVRYRVAEVAGERRVGLIFEKSGPPRPMYPGDF